MTSSLCPRSFATRFGLLFVALLHLAGAATLPFTHGHLPPDSAHELVTTAGTDGDARTAHPNHCTVCNTFASAWVTSVVTHSVADADDGPAAAAFEATTFTAVQPFSSARPRAPPRA